MSFKPGTITYHNIIFTFHTCLSEIKLQLILTLKQNLYLSNLLQLLFVTSFFFTLKFVCGLNR